MSKIKKVSIVLMLLLTAFGLSACGSKKAEKKTNSQSVSSSSKKDVSKASESSTAKASSSSSSSSSTASSSTNAWAQLSQAQKNQLFAAWLQNSQGVFVIYNGYQNGTLIINQGSNGAHDSEPGSGYAGQTLKEEENSAFFVVNGDQVSMMAPNGEKNGGYSGDWANMTWQVQESMSTQDLINKYSAQMEQAAKQIKTTNAGQP